MIDVIVADRPDDLVGILADRLSDPLDDPFESEWISVPSLGFRNWARQKLSSLLGTRDGSSGHRGGVRSEAVDGVLANVEFPFPGALRWVVLDSHRRAVGLPGETDPWQVDQLSWSVLEVLSDPPAELRSALSPAAAEASPVVRARSVAELFDRYFVYRPEMVLRWAEGHDEAADGSRLSNEYLWQPSLFRSLRGHIAATRGVEASPPERLLEALAMLRSNTLEPTTPSGRRLPSRLFVMGQSTVSADFGPIFQALSKSREIVALLLSPSARQTRQLAAAALATGPAVAPNAITWSAPRVQFAGIARGGHPLVDTWGSRSMDTALMLGTGGVVPNVAPASQVGPRDAGILVHDPPATQLRRATLLQRIQAAIHSFDAPAGASKPTGHVDASPDASHLDPDRSLQIHAAPGRTRQVEVLRDVILDLLDTSENLNEGDIAILCPRLDDYAPVISSVLGAPAARGEQPHTDRVPALRYSIVDRSVRARNPVMDAMATILDSVGTRFDVETVESILTCSAVRHRFGLTSVDLELFAEWASVTNTRWGIDGAQRAQWGIDSTYQANSWAWGLDQLMMGVAIGEDMRDAPVPASADRPGETDLQSRALRFRSGLSGIPAVYMSDGRIPSAGRLASAVRSVAEVNRLLGDGKHRPLLDWYELIRRVADLMVETAQFMEWQRGRFDDALAEVIEASTDSSGLPSDVPIGLGDMRRLLAPRLDSSSTRAEFGYGSIAVARPRSLASVPFKVVCILGLDADSLPVGVSSGDDLCAVATHLADRDVRAEARSDLLSAITSAQECLVITCTSRSVRTNEPVPTAVVVDELLDVVADAVDCSTQQLSDGYGGIFVRHPRQSFDPANFGGGGSLPFSFDPISLQGATQLIETRFKGISDQPEFLTVPLRSPSAVDRGDPVELDDLFSFFKHPVRSFFRTTLGVAIPSERDDVPRGLPVAVSNLQKSSIGQELLSDVAFEQYLNRARSVGALPPEPLLQDSLRKVGDEVRQVREEVEGLGLDPNETRSREIRVELPGGVRVVGVLANVTSSAVVDVRFKRPDPCLYVQQAIALMVLTLDDPEIDWQGVLVTREATKKSIWPAVACRRVAGDTPEDRVRCASTGLATLIEQFTDGLNAALPLFNKTSYQLHHSGSGTAEWGSPRGDVWRNEAADPYHRLAFGDIAYDELAGRTLAGHSLAQEAERLWGTIDITLDDVTDAEVSR